MALIMPGLISGQARHGGLSQSSGDMKKWSCWPAGTFRPGDLIQVDWQHLGAHGPVVSCEMLLLLKKHEHSGSEFWDALCIDFVTGGRSYIEIQSEDYSTPVRYDEWQEVTLLSRSGRVIDWEI